MNALLFPTILAAGLLVPGWLLGRALRTPAGILGAFLGSAAALLNIVVLLDAAGLRINLTHMGLSVAVVCALLLVVAKFRKGGNPSGAQPMPPSAARGPSPRALPAVIALGFAAVCIRATVEPLSGFDTIFRWDFLARQIFQRGQLDYYPPIAAADFLHYGWCDGIAPLVSTLYLWSYLALGRIEILATIPVVLAPAALLYAVMFRLAALKAGPGAGWWAAALASTSALLLWGIAMGQETGLTALSLLAMFWFLERDVVAPDGHWLAWAGVAAGVGALAREYGLAFVLIGAGTLLARRVPPRRMLEFAAAAILVAAPWYLRNWVRTGNPLYPHELGGLFPGNDVNRGYFAAVQQLIGLGTPYVSARRLGTLFLLLTAPLLVFGTIAVVRLRPGYAAWKWSLLVIAALWVWSIGQTSGGLVYSLRVLTPLLGITAVLGGIWIATRMNARAQTFLLAALAAVAGDAAIRSLYLPIEPDAPWWKLPAMTWHEQRQYSEWWNTHASWSALTDAAEGRLIIVDAPYAHALLARQGARPVPLFSPAIAYLFSGNAFDDQVARLRREGVRFIVRSIGNNVVDAQLLRTPFFRTLETHPPTAKFPTGHVYDLYLPELGGPMGPARPATPP